MSFTTTLKVLFVFVTLFSLAYSEVFNVKVGPGNKYDPATLEINAKANDQIVWTFNGRHDVVRSDSKDSCTATTVKDNKLKSEILSEGTYNYTITADDIKAKKIWYFCSVPGHCESGMTGTINLAGSNNTTGGNNTDTPTTTSSGSASSPSSSGNINFSYNLATLLVLASSMIVAALLA